MGAFDDAAYPHVVVVNHEGQYSIWPVDLPVPVGWDACHRGSREECLAKIDELWVDMRPRSLREAMDGPEHGS